MTTDELITMNFGSIYVSKDFENYNGEEVKKIIFQNIDSDRWIYLYGENRTGKTHLLSAFYKYFVSKNIVNIRARKCIVLDRLFSHYDLEERENKIDDICKCKILLLDDLGVGKLTPERHSQYYYIIDHRISNNLKTIITSNYQTKDLWCGQSDEMPTRIISRIQEASIGIKVERAK